ncbi:hypothetical protein D3C72_2012960 [compost metagenome]
MLKAVEFDDEFPVRTDKIDNIGTNRDLTSKLVAVQKPVADLRPEDRLGIGRIDPHLPGPLSGQFGKLSGHLGSPEKTKSCRFTADDARQVPASSPQRGRGYKITILATAKS